MKHSALFLFSILVSGSAWAGCFMDHLHEALELNAHRKPLYSSLSRGASEKVSEGLMAMERSMLWWNNHLASYESWAAPYEKEGIAILCDSYVSMSSVSSFAESFVGGPPPVAATVSPRKVVKVLDLTTKATLGNWQGLKTSALAQIEALGDTRLNCLSRHFLESIARIAAFAPVHEAQARKAGLSNPTWIHRRMILGHLYYMSQVIRLDEAARPLQLKGLPILCQDIPLIHVP